MPSPRGPRSIPFVLVASATAAIGFPAATFGLIAYGLSRGASAAELPGSYALLILGSVIGAFFLALSLWKLPAHRRLLAATTGLAERRVGLGPLGFALSVSGMLEGVACRVSRREIWLDHAGPRVVTIDRAALVDLAHGPSGVRPPLAPFAPMLEARRAAARLLELGRRDLRLELDASGLRVVGATPADALEAARQALRLARAPAFVRARTTGTAVCPFCKGGTSWREPEGIFRCPSCESTHHTACWRDHGGCAIFGCARSPDRRETRVEADAPVEPASQRALRARA